MKRKVIAFTAPKTAEYIEQDRPRAEGPRDVVVKMEYTVVSGGTERACIMNMPNTPQHFPIYLGYCGVGYVVEIGSDVTKVKVGDRVLVYHGIHTNYNIREDNEITKVENDEIDSLDAAFVVIATMGLGGVRRLEIEIGQSAMVMGLGLLGMFSIEFCRLNGAYPVIAVDPNEERRELALKLGADYAFDPTDKDFVEKVMAVTGGKGVKATVEVTGLSVAMKQALDVASYAGKVSLLGCTRVSDCLVDFYTKVHRPGVELIGAHNQARPLYESYPHHWTHHDDCKAILDLIAAGRIEVKQIVSRIVKPETAPQIFKELCDDPKFPIGTVFDWRGIE